MYKVVSHDLLTFLKTFGLQTIIMVKIPQFQTAAWKYPLKAQLKVLCVTRRGFSVFIFMTHTLDLCGARHTCLESHCSLAKRSHRGASTITHGFLPALIS